MESKSSGIGLLGILTIVFVVLKLTGNITWSWWWVLSPLWLPLVIVGGIAAIAFFVALIVKEMR